MSDANEVPLIELLRLIPADGVIDLITQRDMNGLITGSRNIPVGSLMHRAADELAQVQLDKAEYDALKHDIARYTEAENENEHVRAKLIMAAKGFCERAEKAESECEALKHDIARYVQHNSELIAERDAARRKELDRIAKWLTSYDDDGGAGEAWGRRFAYEIEQKELESAT